MQTMLSSGAARFDTPAGLYPDEDTRRKNQIALEGLFAPTASYDGTLLSSSSPEPNDPQVAIRIYRGDTGLDTGRAQNAYSLDPTMMHQGRLNREAQANLKIGESASLPDGTKVSFDGYKRWISVQVSHDPAQTWVLVSSIVMLVGLVVSLIVKRRRIWARLVPDSDNGDRRRTVVEIAGLARTDQAGWGEGFDEQARGLLTDDNRRLRRL
ncbi:putative cytochrome C biogenesis protein [Mycobacteroides abscessus subsp. abscessus]|nr:putative cytochrome C biogenesis protein [Mycobacteroides abscessus subsp. abscessus]